VVTTTVETKIAEGEISSEAVFDTDYLPMPGTNPVQYTTGFVDFADKYIRPVLDGLMAWSPRIYSCAMTDINGYLPTHTSERSQPQSHDPEWNSKFCRNRRNFIEDVTRRAIKSEKEFLLVTFRIPLTEHRYFAVKSVFIPVYFLGRRWGNMEMAFCDVPWRKCPAGRCETSCLSCVRPRTAEEMLAQDDSSSASLPNFGAGS
jgi:methyl-accepting chemotaxis protein